MMLPIPSVLGNVDPAGAELSGGGGGCTAVAMATNIINNTTAFSKRSCCFKLFGYDIMVSSNLRLILIKVNHLPLWGTNSPLNQDIKFRTIMQALRAIDMNAQDKKSFECARRRQSLAPIATKRGSSARNFPWKTSWMQGMSKETMINQEVMLLLVQ